MKLSNPISLLLLLVLVNAVGIAAIAMNSKAIMMLPEEKLRLLFLCASSFLVNASIAVILGNKLISTFVEPMELAASKILSIVEKSAGTDAKSADTEKSNSISASSSSRESSGEKDSGIGTIAQDLPGLTDLLITELETARQRERLIADYASDLLCCLDEKRRVLDLNVQSESVLEYPIISLLATPLDLLIHAEDKDEYLKYFDACKFQAQNKPLECRVSSRSGRLIDLEWQVEWSPTSQHYYCLAKNISDRKENQRLKAEITAMVGHDLRAPASSLSFLLDNLHAGTFGELPREAVEKVAKASDNVGIMLKLINQLLDADKLEGGQMEVDLKFIPLSELYEACAELLGDLAEKRRIKLQFPAESQLIVLADFDRTVQILCNLLSNAIKWSPADSRVEVSEQPDGRSVCISVKDLGPGIAADRQLAIFERFKSLDNRSDKTLASSGLGLYIAKKLTELQGGTIGLKSKLGEGSTFSISFRQVAQHELPGYLDM